MGMWSKRFWFERRFFWNVNRVSISQALQLAFQHHQQGRLAEAESIYQQVLAAEPGNIEAISLLGLLYAQAGHGDAAAPLLLQAAQIDHRASYIHHRLAVAWRALGDAQQVVRACEAAVQVDSAHVDSLYLLAVTLFENGHLEPASMAMRQCVALRPAVDLYSDLGVMLEKLGRLTEAETVYREGLRANPQFAPIHTNLGATLAQQGRLEEALAEHMRSAQLDPSYHRAFVNWADTAHQLGQLDVAMAAAGRAVELNANDPDAHIALGEAQCEIGQCDEATRSYAAAAELWTQSGTQPERVIRARIMSATMLPQIYSSSEEMLRWRTRLTENIERLRNENLRLPLDGHPAPTLFGLAYQGLDDRAILEAYSSLMQPPSMEIPKPARGTKIRVGFISRFFRDHTIGRLNVGVVEHLDRSDFEVIVFSIGDYSDALAMRFRAAADRFVVLPQTLPVARQMILAESIDILFYTDLGMDPLTYTLAHSRLAPVQCTTWGHPVTSGISTIDYFISSTLLETGDSQSQYSEKLALLPQLAIYYEQPELPALRKSRADFGISAQTHVYGCLQTLLKLHPEFDAVLAAILRRDPAGVVLLIKGLHDHWEQQLTARWQAAIPDVAARIRFVPRVSREDFLSLTSKCDVMLDPIHFCGGNTSYEALAFGVPIVTFRSHYLRGRLTTAMYEMMEMPECIADALEDYVDIAVRLGTDGDYRKSISSKIVARGEALFGNMSAVRDLEKFFYHSITIGPAAAYP